MNKTTAQLLGQARQDMQHLIDINSPLRERQERLINHLKARIAQGN